MSRCPICQSSTMQQLWSIHDVPIHSVRIMSSAAEARISPRGTIQLVQCRCCRHVFNAAFDPEVMEYGTGYESTQACSETFDKWHRHLAQELVARHKLKGKRVVEIGCGNGEFLHLLHEAGAGECIGFDPAYDRKTVWPDVTIVSELFNERHYQSSADFYICKMTLEHVAEPVILLRAIREAAGDVATVYCQVPDASRILEYGIFWDVYYEHCAYFTASSLATAFRYAGYQVDTTKTGYRGQYLMMEATARSSAKIASFHPMDAMDSEYPTVDPFADNVARQLAYWSAQLATASRPVLWGGGSKAVAFLTALRNYDQHAFMTVQQVVDINPRRQETYLPGNGQLIVAPEQLATLDPDLIICMNPAYKDEISLNLTALGLSPRLIALEDDLALRA